MKLLTRDEFRESVQARDNYACVNCGISGPNVKLDSHHICERRLFADGGYYLDNGATLCDPTCHMFAEMTILSPQTLREKCGIKNIVLPDHLYKDNEYDKWGNIVFPNGRRLKGELFYDESVQKILKAGNVLSLFDSYVKYPRTYHLPWSPGRTKDDRVLENINNFIGKRVVVSLKMDGENTTLYNDYIHARSLEGNSHPSQTYVRNLHSKIAHDIPAGMRICGENLYAKHSIGYENLESYFYVFSIWNENVCLSWPETLEYAELLGLSKVPVFYWNIFDEKTIRDIFARDYAASHEGYVIRLEESFNYGDFRKSVAKWVRPNHVAETVHNWRNGWYAAPETVNKLK
jgi:hypothetical protein